MFKRKKLIPGGVGMRKLLLFLLAISLAFAGWALAEEEKPFELEVSVGGSINDYDDAPNRAAEYKSQVDMDSSWYLSGKFSLDLNDVLFSVEGRYIEKEDQDYAASFDFRRVISIKSNFSRFWHRYDTDFMENLQAQSVELRGGTWDSPITLSEWNTYPAALRTKLKDVKDVDGDGLVEGASASLWHSSYETTQKYGVKHSFWTNEAILRLPALPGVQIGFKHRMEERRGWDQARTISKCSGCHVGAYSRHIEEYTNDYIPYIEARLGQWTFKYSFMYRSFNSGDTVPRHLYLNVQGPAPVPPSYPAAAFKPTFGNAPGQFPGELQVNYDYSNGELPFARTPDSEKWQHVVKAKWDISPYQSLNLNFVYSEAQNEDSDQGEGGAGPLYGDFDKELEIDYTAFTGNWHFRFRKNMTLTLKAKYHSMDGDDVFVDLPREYNSWKDPDVDGTNFDFERKSAYDEDEFIFGADLAWRYSRALKFRFAYELEYIDRNNAEEHHVTEDTTKHQFKLSSTWKPRHGLKVKAHYNFLYVNDPYAYKHAVCPKNADSGVDYIALGEKSWYSYIVYGRRQGDTSNQPEYEHDLGLKIDYIINAKANLNLYGSYIYSENDNTDFYDWEKDYFAGGINLTLMPSTKIGINVGYNYLYEEYTSLMCSSIYHG